jgi:hypothetical protein
MIHVLLAPLPGAGAERALAELWVCIENGGLQTPKLHIQFIDSDLICLGVTMRDATADNLSLEGWIIEWKGQVKRWPPIFEQDVKLIPIEDWMRFDG